jgi:hypothetical protein
MKKNIISIMLLTALAFVAGSCGGDSESDPVPTPEPVPSYLTPGTDVRPTTWTAPSPQDYELWMSLQVQLGDELADYQSSADLVCATVNGEVRAATAPMTTGDIIYYPLTIGGNGGDQTVSLHYYCDRLHRIYTIANWAAFKEGIAPTGESGIYRPCFTESYK